MQTWVVNASQCISLSESHLSLLALSTEENSNAKELALTVEVALWK